MFTVRWRFGKKAVNEKRVSKLNLRRAFAGTRGVNKSRIMSHVNNYLPSHDNARCYGDLEAVAKLAKENPKNSRIIILAPNDGERLDMEKLVHRTMENSTRNLGTMRYAFAIHDKGDSAHLMNSHAHIVVICEDDYSKQKLWPTLRREARIEATKQLGGLQDDELDVEKAKEVQIGVETREHMELAVKNGLVHEYPSTVRAQETWRGREAQGQALEVVAPVIPEKQEKALEKAQQVPERLSRLVAAPMGNSFALERKAHTAENRFRKVTSKSYRHSLSM